MTETKNTGDKTLTVAPTKTLTLKRPVEQGVVRQSFSHGRSKAVVVENEQKEKLSREVVLPETITIQELANRMAERAVDVIKFLMKQGQMAKITDT
jgi:hypothetical protein